MGFSLNAFLIEVRRHFGKYPPSQKSEMMFKFSLAVSVFVFALIATGIGIDQYHSEDPVDMTLENGAVYHAPGVSMGTFGVKLTFPECETPETADREQSKLFDPRGVTFDELSKGPTGTDEVYDLFVNPGDDSISTQYFGDFNNIHKMSKIARIFTWVALAIQGIVVGMSLWSRTPPSSFLTDRPTFNQTSKERTLGLIHHSLSIVVVIFLLLNLGIVSTYLDQVEGRVIDISFELCNFAPYSNEIDTLKLVGHFLSDFSDVNGFSGRLFRAAISLTGFLVVLVFFQGTDQVRSESTTTGYSLPASRLRQLPWYCSIWRFRFSFMFLVTALIINIFCSAYTREHGYALNMYAWTTVASSRTGSGLTRTGAMADFIMDRLSKFFIAESIPFTILWGCVLIVIALAIGSTDPLRFFSKLTQISGLIVFLKAITSITTIMPSPSTVFDRPYCYDPPSDIWTFKGIFSISLTCNSLMFSLVSAVTTASVMVVVMYIRYGPSARHVVSYYLLFAFIILFDLLPVTARATYSTDSLIGAYLGFLIMMSQSMAFKLLFRFDFPVEDFTQPIRKLNFQPGELLNDKIIPTLIECCRRIEMYQQASRDAPGLKMASNEVEEIELLYKTVGEAMKLARAAKPMQPVSAEGPERPIKALAKPKTPETPKDESIDDLMAMMTQTNQPTKALAKPKTPETPKDESIDDLMAMATQTNQPQEKPIENPVLSQSGSSNEGKKDDDSGGPLSP
jgi:hypothetical protein